MGQRMIGIGLAWMLAVEVASVAAQATGTGVIKGQVVTGADRRPVAAALVRILDQHLSDQTHADGRFLIGRVPTGPRRVLVAAIGYRAAIATVEVPVNDTVAVDVVLSEAVLQLDEIVTTGTTGDQSRRDALSPTSVVSGAALDRQVDGTIAASLRHEPGVAMSGISPATAQPVIRGLGGDRVVVLQDGLRAGDLAATAADHAVSVDPLTAQRIEVVRGPMSLRYGSSALGGVVNVIREDIPASRPDEIHGTLSAQGTSVNRGGAVGGFALAPVGPFAVRMEGTFRKSGDTRTPVGRLVNTDQTAADVAAGLATVGRRGHVGASYRYYHNDYGIPGGFVGGHPTGVDIAMRRHTIRSSAEVHPGRGPWESVKADVGLTFYRHTEFEPSGAVGTLFKQTFLTGTVQTRHRGLLGGTGGALGVSGQYRFIRTGGTLRTPSTADYSVSGFAIEEYGSGPLRLQAGLRYDLAWYELRRTSFITIGTERVATEPRAFGSFSGSLGLLWEVAAGIKVGGSVARAYRTPDFNELYSNGPHLASNAYEVGDPRLDEEAGLGVDAFLRVDRERIHVELAGFSNRLSNYIFPSSRGRAVIGRQGGRPVFQFTNEGARFSGAEGVLSLGLTDRLALEATASYVAASFTTDRAPIPIIDPPDTTFVAASKYPPLIPPLFGNVELRYEQPRYFVGAGVRWAAAQNRLGDFETRTDGHAVGDVHAGVRLLLGGQFHTITLRIDNVANAEYRDHLSRIKEIEPNPGRNVSVLYRLTF